MNLTTPQVETLHDVLRRDFRFAGSVELSHLGEVDEWGQGDIDVRVFHDTEEIHSFEIDAVGRLCHNA